MHFAESSEHRLVRESAHKFAQKEIAPGIAEIDRNQESDPGALKKMGEAGLLDTSISVAARTIALLS